MYVHEALLRNKVFHYTLNKVRIVYMDKANPRSNALSHQVLSSNGL